MTIKLSEIKALCEGATPGEWVWNPHDSRGCSDYMYSNSNEKLRYEEIITTDAGFYGPSKPDRDFIAASRTLVPELVAWVERARECLESYIPPDLCGVSDCDECAPYAELKQLLSEIEK